MCLLNAGSRAGSVHSDTWLAAMQEVLHLPIGNLVVWWHLGNSGSIAEGEGGVNLLLLS
jgi:hypothetical protein